MATEDFLLPANVARPALKALRGRGLLLPLLSHLWLVRLILAIFSAALLVLSLLVLLRLPVLDFLLLLSEPKTLKEPRPLLFFLLVGNLPFRLLRIHTHCPCEQQE